MKLKAGIIGLGVGEAHIEAYRSHPGSEVVALCDLDEKKLEMARKKYPGLKVVREADDILEDPSIQVVSVASYDDDHHDQILKAVKNGKHVFVEKPLCLSEEEAKDIHRAFRSKPDLQLSSNLILRMSPRFRLLKQMIAQKKLGEVFYAEADYNYGRLHKITEGWRGKLDFYSVVYGGGVHVVDLLQWLIADRVIEVSAFGNQIASKGSRFRYNDCVAAILKFQNGAIGKISANFGCVYPHFHPVSVYGTRGTFENTPQGAFFYGSRDAAVPPERIEAEYPGTRKGDLIHGFIDSILKKSVSEVPAEDVFSTMEVCFAIERSARDGKPVRVQSIGGGS